MNTWDHLRSALPILHGSCSYKSAESNVINAKEMSITAIQGWCGRSKGITHCPGCLQQDDVHLPFAKYTAIHWTACTIAWNVCVPFKLKGGRYSLVAVLTSPRCIKCSQLWLRAPLRATQPYLSQSRCWRLLQNLIRCYLMWIKPYQVSHLSCRVKKSLLRCLYHLTTHNLFQERPQLSFSLNGVSFFLEFFFKLIPIRVASK